MIAENNKTPPILKYIYISLKDNYTLNSDSAAKKKKKCIEVALKQGQKVVHKNVS